MNANGIRHRLVKFASLTVLLSVPFQAFLLADCPNTKAVSGFCQGTHTTCLLAAGCPGVKRDLEVGYFYCSTKNGAGSECLGGGDISLCWTDFSCKSMDGGCVKDMEVQTGLSPSTYTNACGG